MEGAANPKVTRFQTAQREWKDECARFGVDRAGIRCEMPSIYLDCVDIFHTQALEAFIDTGGDTLRREVKHVQVVGQVAVEKEK